MPGVSTSGIEVTHIPPHGLWLLTNGGKFFLPFEEFPWPKETAIARILKVEEPSSGPITCRIPAPVFLLDIVRNPERFPLRFSLRTEPQLQSSFTVCEPRGSTAFEPRIGVSMGCLESQ